MIAEQVDVDVQRQPDGTLNFANLVKPGPSTEWSITIADTRVHHGHLRYDDQNFDDLLLDGTAHIPHGGTTTATLAMSATWREKHAPVDLVATLANDALETTIPALAGRVGDVDVSALGARIVKDTRPIDDILAEAGIVPPRCREVTPRPTSVMACLPEAEAPPQISGLFVVSATRAAVAALAPDVDMPADVAVAVRVWGREGATDKVALAGKSDASGSVKAKTGAAATEHTTPIGGGIEDAIAIGVVGGSPVYAFIEGDIVTEHLRGFVAATGIDVGAYAHRPGRANGVVAFDLIVPGGTAEGAVAAAATAPRAKLPVATAMISAWGEPAGGPPIVLRAAVTSDGTRAHTLVGANAPGLSAALAAIVRVDGSGTTLEDARLVARAPNVGTASGKLPLYGALHADLAAHGTVSPVMALAVSGTADGEHLRYADWHVASLQVTLDTKALPHQPFGSARVVLAGVDHNDIHLETLSIAAADRPDHGIDVGIRTRPVGRPWLVDADATVYPGATTRIDITRHHVRAAGNDWEGTTGHVEIGPRGYAIRGFKSTSKQGTLAVDAAYTHTGSAGHVTLDLRGDGPLLGSAHVALDMDAPANLGDPAGWAQLRRGAVHSGDIAIGANLDAVAAALGLPGPVTGRIDANVKLTPRDGTGKIVIAKLHAPALREVGAISATIDLADDANDKVTMTTVAQVDGVGGITLDASGHTPDHVFDPRAWRTLGRAGFDGATLRVHDVALDPALFDQLHVETAMRGKLGIALDVDAGARSFKLDVDVHELRGGPLAAPIDVHTGTTIDGAGTRATIAIRGKAGALADARVDLPVTTADLFGPRDALLAKKLAGTITLPSTQANQLLATVGRSDITSGTVDGVITLSGTLGAPLATAKLAAHDLVVPRGRNVSLLELDGSWDGAIGKVAITGHEDGGGELKITASGSPAALDKVTAQLDATHFDLRPLMAFAPGPAGAVTGTIDGKLTMTGVDPRTAELAGTLSMRDARVPIAPAIGTLHKTSIDLKIENRIATISLDGTLGKGTVSVRGQAPLSGEQGNATITLRKVRPIGSVEPVIDADITADIHRDHDRWEANIVVSHGLVAIPDAKGHKLDPVGPPDDFSFGVASAPPPPVRKPRSEPAKVPPPERPYLVCRIQIDATHVESTDFRGVIDGKLRVSFGTPSAGRSPIGIVGDIQAERGDLDLFDRRYQLDHAIVHFDGSIDPVLDVRITYDFPDVTTITEVRGRLSKPELLAVVASPGSTRRASCSASCSAASRAATRSRASRRRTRSRARATSLRREPARRLRQEVAAGRHRRDPLRGRDVDEQLRDHGRHLAHARAVPRVPPAPRVAGPTRTRARARSSTG